MAADWRLLDELPMTSASACIGRLPRCRPRIRPPTENGGRRRRADERRARGSGSARDRHPRARRRPVVTTPNVFPPERAEPRATTTNRERRTPNHHAESTPVYVCKAAVLAAPRLLRSTLPRLRRRQLRRANRAGRSARARRAADRRARQDRLPGRPEAAALRRAPDRHDPVSAQCRVALRAGA